MLAEQFVLEEIIFRSVTAERFQRHPEDEQAAIDGVTSPGPVGAAGHIKRDHYPNAEKEEDRDENDLAQQKNAIKTLRALRDHG